jgi:hypothetical protein
MHIVQLVQETLDARFEDGTQESHHVAIVRLLCLT